MKISKQRRLVVKFYQNIHWLFIGVIVLFLLNGLLTLFIKDWSNRGTFGDQFGAVNALFSGLAFAGLIVTILLQRRDLRLQRKDLRMQRKELELTRKEMEDQTAEFSRQNETLRRQTFENTFFHMMELQQQIVNDLYAKEDSEKIVEERTSNAIIRKNVTVENIYKGRNLFMYAFVHGEHQVNYEDGRNVKAYGIGGVMQMRGFAMYDQYYTSTYFDHYFRHFYRILKFIKQNSDWLTFEEQYQYSSLLRATLSRYELVWLYYNGLSDNGRHKLKPLMEEYSILKNMREDLLVLSRENVTKIYNAGLKRELLKANGFSGTDYEFFLSDTHSPFKYNLSAFYNKEELEIGRGYYDRWSEFCKNSNVSID